MRKLLIPLVLLSTSCFAYRNSFDTVPSSGIPRASVSQIEAMIVEHDNGPDALDPYRGMPHSSRCKSRLQKSCLSKKKRCCRPRTSNRVWVETKATPDGGRICGHYVALPTIGDSDV